MNKDFAFLFKPGDYLRDTQCLSEKTQVAYDRIMCEHMRNICISQAQLNFFTKRLSPDEISELMFMLKKVEGGFEIEWVAESIRERIAYSDSRRKNREGKPKKDKKTYVPHMEGDSEDDSIVVYKKMLAKILSKNSIELPHGFEALILEWLKYKAEKGQSYKETGMKKMITVFLKDSNCDLTTAQSMLDFSMSKNYTGLFKPTNNGINKEHHRRDGERTNDHWNR